jgi:hypothetical protein
MHMSTHQHMHMSTTQHILLQRKTRDVRTLVFQASCQTLGSYCFKKRPFNDLGNLSPCKVSIIYALPEITCAIL